MRVGLVSFIHESNTFNPVFTTREMFDDNVVFGDEIIHRWGEAHHEVGGMIEEVARVGVELVPLVAAWVMPAGPLLEGAYEEILEEILTRVSGESLDGLLLSLHGAMVSSHIRDADGNTAENIRQLVGSSLPVVLTLDLHGNVSPRMIENVTATTIYRTYPHLDQRERAGGSSNPESDSGRGNSSGSKPGEASLGNHDFGSGNHQGAHGGALSSTRGDHPATGDHFRQYSSRLRLCRRRGDGDLVSGSFRWRPAKS